MKIPFWELLPDFEPQPPLTRMPRDYVSTWTENVQGVGDGSMRWCACRVFQKYVGARYKWPVPGEELTAQPLNPRCTALTRGYWHTNHHKVVLAELAECQGYGYKACLIDDPTPRVPSEVAELFGIKLTHVFWTRVANTEHAAKRRGQYHKIFAEKPLSAERQQANRIADML